jgi:TPR repeat protein
MGRSKGTITKMVYRSGIIDKRLGGILAVTRAFGDTELDSQGISHQPQTTKTIATLHPGERAFMVVTCDGAMEHLKGDNVANQAAQELGSLLATGIAKGVPQQQTLAERIVDNALKNGSQDNISAMVTELHIGQPPLTAAVFDGHGGNKVSTDLSRHFVEHFGKAVVMEQQLQQQESSVIDFYAGLATAPEGYTPLNFDTNLSDTLSTTLALLMKNPALSISELHKKIRFLCTTDELFKNFLKGTTASWLLQEGKMTRLSLALMQIRDEILNHEAMNTPRNVVNKSTGETAYSVGQSELAKANPDFNAAVKQLRIAITHRNVDAVVELATLYRLGKGVPPYAREATTLYRQALHVNPKHPAANYGLATLYEASGKLTEAALYYRQAADAGDTTAPKDLQRLRSENPTDQSILNQVIIRNFNIYAANPQAQAETAFTTGVQAYINEDYLETHARFSDAAQAGNGKALIELGLMHEDGLCSIPKNLEEASHYYKAAATQGNATVLGNHYLGNYFLQRNSSNGNKDSKDYQQAVAFYERALQQITTPTIGAYPMIIVNTNYNLGFIYEQGFHKNPPAPDLPHALDCYLTAHNKGQAPDNATAQPLSKLALTKIHELCIANPALIAQALQALPQDATLLSLQTANPLTTTISSRLSGHPRVHSVTTPTLPNQENPITAESVDPQYLKHAELANYLMRRRWLADGSWSELDNAAKMHAIGRLLVTAVTALAPFKGRQEILASLQETETVLSKILQEGPQNTYIFCDTIIPAQNFLLEIQKVAPQSSTTNTRVGKNPIGGVVNLQIGTDSKEAVLVQSEKSGHCVSELYLPAATLDPAAYRELAIKQIESARADSRGSGPLCFDSGFTLPHLQEAIRYCNQQGYPWTISTALEKALENEPNLKTLLQETSATPQPDLTNWLNKSPHYSFAALSKPAEDKLLNELGLAAVVAAVVAPVDRSNIVASPFPPLVVGKEVGTTQSNTTINGTNFNSHP